MSADALALFKQALAKVAEEPEFPAREVVTSQLEYLIALVEGRADRSKLSQVSVGLFAARQLDGWDKSDIPDLLFTVQSEARKL
jgi:hypothetical protein